MFLKYVQIFMKIYTTLVSALMHRCSCCTHRHFPLPEKKNLYETLYSDWSNSPNRKLEGIQLLLSLSPKVWYIMFFSNLVVCEDVRYTEVILLKYRLSAIFFPDILPRLPLQRFRHWVRALCSRGTKRVSHLCTSLKSTEVSVLIMRKLQKFTILF